MTPTLSIVERAKGTYSILLDRGQGPKLWRANVPTETEARRRAQVVADLCGYRVKGGRRGR